MEKETNEERFYAWMRKINSIHLAGNVKMAAAFHKIATIKMRAGYKSVYSALKTDRILVVANLPRANEVFIFSAGSEKQAKENKDQFDIGFWRIKRK